MGTLERNAPPFFKQGPSALSRLAMFSALALFLMVADARFHITDPFRQIVATVLTTPALRAMWEEELAGMRVRIKEMRKLLQDRLVASGTKQDFSFITRQKGMFSYTGLAKAQMERLRSEFGIYGVDSGRICVAALNHGNIDAVVKAIGLVT